MFAGQRVAGQAVVKVLRQHLAPIGCIMTSDTIFSEPALVNIIRGMTVEAGPGDIVPGMFRMAIQTDQGAVFVDQRESGQCMIEFVHLPALRSVTGSAILAQAARMGVVFEVAADAFLRSLLQLGKILRPFMATGAGKFEVLSCQRERRLLMVETRSEAVDAIMTIKATGVEINQV